MTSTTLASGNLSLEEINLQTQMASMNARATKMESDLANANRAQDEKHRRVAELKQQVRIAPLLLLLLLYTILKLTVSFFWLLLLLLCLLLVSSPSAAPSSLQITFLPSYFHHQVQAAEQRNTLGAKRLEELNARNTEIDKATAELQTQLTELETAKTEIQKE